MNYERRDGETLIRYEVVTETIEERPVRALLTMPLGDWPCDCNRCRRGGLELVRIRKNKYTETAEATGVWRAIEDTAKETGWRLKGPQECKAYERPWVYERKEWREAIVTDDEVMGLVGMTIERWVYEERTGKYTYSKGEVAAALPRTLGDEFAVELRDSEGGLLEILDSRYFGQREAFGYAVRRAWILWRFKEERESLLTDLVGRMAERNCYLIKITDELQKDRRKFCVIE